MMDESAFSCQKGLRKEEELGGDGTAFSPAPPPALKHGAWLRHWRPGLQGLENSPSSEGTGPPGTLKQRLHRQSEAIFLFLFF